jgi:hypothetical protein
MSVMTATAPTRTGSPPTRIGVGIDIIRYICSDLFGRTVAPARLRFGLYSSPDGSYIPGTGMLFRRR